MFSLAPENLWWWNSFEDVEDLLGFSFSKLILEFWCYFFIKIHFEIPEQQHHNLPFHCIKRKTRTNRWKNFPKFNQTNKFFISIFIALFLNEIILLVLHSLGRVFLYSNTPLFQYLNSSIYKYFYGFFLRSNWQSLMFIVN